MQSEGCLHPSSSVTFSSSHCPQLTLQPLSRSPGRGPCDLSVKQDSHACSPPALAAHPRYPGDRTSSAFPGVRPPRPSLHWAEQVWWPIAMVAPARHTPGSLAPAPVGNSVLKEPPIHLVLT